jgi:putative transport protein
MQLLHHYLNGLPLLALFITIFLGYTIGKIKIKTFVLGGIAGSLIMGVIIGQLDIHLSPAIGGIFFALFIYAVGYQGGAQFFRSLNRKMFMQLLSATITCVLGLMCVLLATWWFGLDRGTAAGLAAGGLTQSSIIGTANDAITRLHLASHITHQLQANVAVGYAVCYIFGSFGPILMLTAVFPAMMRWNIRKEAKALAASMPGGKAALEPGQFKALNSLTTRVFQLTSKCLAVGKSAGSLFETRGHTLAVESVLREGNLLAPTAKTLLQANDTVAVTATVAEFAKTPHLFSNEVAKPAIMEVTEENRQVILTNKAFDGITIQALYEQTDIDQHYGLFVKSVSRLGETLPAELNLALKRGDELNLLGRPSDLNKLSKQLGRTITATKVTDFISFAIGLGFGVVLGDITVRIGGVAISLGTGGGCLIAGLLVGWIRSRHPRFGALPMGASNFLRDFGLAVFVATIGIIAGPQAVQTIKHHGLELFLLGIGVTLIPQILTFFISYYGLRIKNPVELLATIAGGRSANPGFAALLEKSGNSTPVVAFTATYTIANIWLTLWGPIIVAFVTKN